MQAPPLVTSHFAGVADVSVKKAGGGACAATSEKSARSASPRISLIFDA